MTDACEQTASRGCRRTAPFGLENPSDQRLYLERVRGIEPPLQAWEACVLPLNYTRGRRRS